MNTAQKRHILSFSALVVLFFWSALSIPAHAASGFNQTESPEESVRSILKSSVTYTPALAASTLKQTYSSKEILPTVAKKVVQASEYDIPLAEHPLVDNYIEYFTTRGRDFFGRWPKRLDRYRDVMVPILKTYDVPEDTIFLAMIESGFVPNAMSRAKAKGFWQFMSFTGKDYGLKQNVWRDERQDFIAATHSAAKHLNRLYKLFGDWHLAWAAYNAGEGRIKRAIESTNAQSYWDLYNTKNTLKKETLHYVPKVIAAATIAKNREKYGFAPQRNDVALSFETITLKNSIDLSSMAKGLNIPLTDLQTLNPALLTSVTPPMGAFSLRLPKGTSAKATQWLAKTPPLERLAYGKYTVQKGDTIYGIARRHGTKVALLESFNKKLKLKNLRYGMKITVPHPIGAKVSQKAPQEPVVRKNKILYHLVKNGESFWSIAKKYNVSIQSLKKWNPKKSAHLRAGESLNLHL